MIQLISGIAAVCAAVILLIFLVYIYLILPSLRRHETLERCLGRQYAHRGLHSKERNIPENSLAAFKAAVDDGYGIELDVRLDADEKLFIMHDDNSRRMTGVDLLISKSHYDEIKALRLGGTDEKVPTFAEVLELVDGKIPLIVELKAIPGRINVLGERVFELLDNYKGDFVVESFDPRMVRWVRRHRPHIARGQLISYFRRHGDKKIAPAIDFMTHNLLFNIGTRPDFVAMYYPDRNSISLKLCRLLGAVEIDWTITSQEQLDICRRDNVRSVIFEGFIPDKEQQ